MRLRASDHLVVCEAIAQHRDVEVPLRCCEGRRVVSQRGQGQAPAIVDYHALWCALDLSAGLT